MHYFIGAIAALLLAASPAKADADWFLIDFGDIATGIDLSSRTRVGDTATIWIILVYAEPNPDEANADYRLSRMEFSCSRRTASQISTSGFVRPGRYVGGSERRSEMMSVAPGTVVSVAYEAACDRSYEADISETFDTESFVAMHQVLLRMEKGD